MRKNFQICYQAISEAEHHSLHFSQNSRKQMNHRMTAPLAFGLVVDDLLPMTLFHQLPIVPISRAAGREGLSRGSGGGEAGGEEGAAPG